MGGDYVAAEFCIYRWLRGLFARLYVVRSHGRLSCYACSCVIKWSFLVSKLKIYQHCLSIENMAPFSFSLAESLLVASVFHCLRFTLQLDPSQVVPTSILGDPQWACGYTPPATFSSPIEFAWLDGAGQATLQMQNETETAARLLAGTCAARLAMQFLLLH